MLLENLCDLINARCQVFDVSPLPEGLSSPDEILHVIILGEIRILQVLVVPEQERSEIKCQISLGLHLRGDHTVNLKLPYNDPVGFEP